MTTGDNQNTTIQTHSALSASILQKIQEEHVEQVPKWQFLLSEYAIWVIWAVSVLIGAIAFSVMLFVLMHSGFAFYEATHNDFFHFLVEVMPYLWVLVFIGMGFLAQYNLKNTKHGYRYTLWQILLSSLLCSLLGGIALHILGVGYLIDTQVGKSIPLYHGIEKMEARIWQSPKQGRLVGTLQSVDEESNVGIFKDTQGEVWTINTQELNPIDMLNLESGKKVRLLGMVSSTTDGVFHGCAVFPIIDPVKVGFGEIRKDRELFLERMNEHHMKLLQNLIASGTPIGIPSLCGNHSAVIRIHKALPQ